MTYASVNRLVVTAILLSTGGACALPPPPNYGLHRVEYVKDADGGCRFTMEGGQEFRGVTGDLSPCGDRFNLGIDRLDAFQGQQLGAPLYSQFLDAESQRRAALLELGRAAGRPAMCAAAAAANVALGALCAGVTAEPSVFTPAPEDSDADDAGWVPPESPAKRPHNITEIITQPAAGIPVTEQIQSLNYCPALMAPRRVTASTPWMVEGVAMAPEVEL